MSTSFPRLAALGAVVLLVAAGLIWWQRADDPAETPSFVPLRDDAERSEVDAPLRSEGRGVPSRAVPLAPETPPLTAPESASTRSEPTNSEASSALVFVYGRIEVEPTGLATPPEIVSARFVDATRMEREARLHDEGRYTCSDLAPGLGTVEVELSSQAKVELAVEIPPQVVEYRLDLRVTAPYHAALPVHVLAPSGRRLLEELAGTKFSWNLAFGLEPFDFWVVASERELPAELRVSSEIERRTWGIGRWLAAVHLRQPQDRDGTLELLRWAPTTHVALYWRGRRVDAQQFQQPPEKLVFHFDPAEIRNLEPAGVKFRCTSALDGRPPRMLQFCDGETNGSRFLPLAADGSALVEGLLPGPHVIELDAQGHVQRRIELELMSGETRDLGEVIFERGRRLRVHALDAEGQPFAGILSVESVDAASSHRRYSLDAEGRRDLTGFDSALHVLALQGKQDEPLSARIVRSLVDLSAGDVLDAELRWPAELFPLEVRVQLEPWEEARCVLLDVEGRPLLRRFMAGATRLEFALPRGSYRLALLSLQGERIDEAAIDLPAESAQVRLAKRGRQ